MPSLAHIRDPQWRERLKAKLSEITAVKEQDAYLSYMHNWHLFDQMEHLSSAHEAARQQQYLIPLRRFEALQSSLEKLAPLHPLRSNKVTHLVKAIGEKLEDHSYEKNAEASPLLDELETYLSLSREEYQNWEKQLGEWRMRLKSLMTEVWAEDYKSLKEDYQQQKALLKGPGFPRKPLEPQSAQVEAARNRRTEDWQQLQRSLRLHPRLRTKSHEMQDTYLPRADFLVQSKKLKQKATRNSFLSILGVLLLGSLSAAGVYYVPLWQQREAESAAWEIARSENTLEAFGTFLADFPSGAYADSAQEAQMAITQGRLLNLTNSEGLHFDYEGEILRLQPTGYGVAWYADSSHYAGYWIAGQRDSLGTWTQADSSVYEGLWQKDKRSGEGKMTYASGEVYNGHWREDAYHGWGSFLGANGREYRGGWRKGQPQGKGVYRYADGSVYDGYWQNGLYHGTGTFSQPDGLKYMGQWNLGKREGEGQLNWDNGARFTGIWEQDTIKGKGIFVNRYRDQLSGYWTGVPEEISLRDGAGNLIKRGRLEGGVFLE